MNPHPSPVGALAAVVLLAAAGALPAQEAGELRFTDITETAGVALPGVLTESVAWGDYDGDGDEDLYLTNDGPNRLFRNDGGDRFTDVGTGAGTRVERSSRGVALVDFDRDGRLDIYVMAVGANILYWNAGGLRFVDVAPATGAAAPATGVGVVASDLNGDGWPEIFTGNRSGDRSSLLVFGSRGFVDVAAEAGLDAAGLGMGVIALDYDNDLDFDLYWTTWPGDGRPVPNALYRNLGNLSFEDVAAEAGTQDPAGWGISANAGDVDNDGWTDFLVTNGFSPASGPNVLFRNRGDGRLEVGRSPEED